MKKKLSVIAVILLVFTFASAQPKNDLQKLVETEMAFAAAAEAKGTKAAFLEFLSDDGIIFRPIAKNGKAFWQTRPESTALLAWRPVWADVSSDGKLGYTTGGWELRPTGKNGAPTAFGQYVTIWQKQTDDSFKAVLDIGISHENPAAANKNDALRSMTNVPSKNAPANAPIYAGWKSPADAGLGDKSVKATVTLDTLTDIFSKKVMSEALFRHLAADAVVLREGHLPFVAKNLSKLELEKIDKNFPPNSYLNFDGNLSPKFGNMMYAYGIYKLTHKDKSVSRWNFMQIWKHRDNRWQLALDIMTPIPPDEK